MSHFAKVVDNVVTEVIVAEPEFVKYREEPEGTRWIQTSYNTYGGVHYGPDGKPDGGFPLRMNFASIGGTYDEERDAFIPKQQFRTWVLNENCIWECPKLYPTDGKTYTWSDDAVDWIELTE
jgi:hypothetical protein